MLCRGSEARHKGTDTVRSHQEAPRAANSLNTEDGGVVPGDWELARVGGPLFSGDRVSVRGDDRVLEAGGGNGRTARACSSCRCSARFLKVVKTVDFTSCIFYHCIQNLFKKQTC